MKRTRTFFSIFIFFLFPFLVSAQSDSLSSKRCYFNTSILEFLPSVTLNTGNFNLGAEYYLNNGKSLYVNLGLIKSYGEATGWFDVPSKSTKGFKIQMEAKKYLGKRKLIESAILIFWPHIFQYQSQNLQNTGYYIGLNSYFQFTSTSRTEIVSQGSLPENIYEVQRNITGLRFKIGYVCLKKSGFEIDYSVGLGANYISSSTRNKIDLDSKNEKDFPWNKAFDHDSGIFPDLLYQIRIGI